MVKRKDFNIQTNTQMDKQTNRRTNIEKQLIGQTGKMIDIQKIDRGIIKVIQNTFRQ